MTLWCVDRQVCEEVEARVSHEALLSMVDSLEDIKMCDSIREVEAMRAEFKKVSVCASRRSALSLTWFWFGCSRSVLALLRFCDWLRSPFA